MILYAIIAGLSAAAPTFLTLYALRLAAGVAAAGMLVATFPLFEELLPVNVRGRYTVYLASGWPIGLLMALGATVLFTPLGWRAILGFSAVAGAWAIVVAFLAPESPYWLARVGQKKAARAVLERLSCGRMALPNANALTVELPAKGSLFDVFKGRLFWITALQVAVNFAFSWGYWVCRHGCRPCFSSAA